MAGIWVYSEDVEITKQLLALGREVADKMQKPLCALTIADNAQELVAFGAEKVFVLKGDSNWAEGYATAIADLAKKEAPEAIFMGATLRGKDVAAKVAALLDTGLSTEATAIRVEGSAIEADRMVYGGLAVRTDVLAAPAMATIPARSYEPLAKDDARTGEVVEVAAAFDGKVTIGNVSPIIRQGADLSVAEKVIGVGRGLGKEADLEMVKELAGLMGAEIGCSRSIAEDYHWMPPEAYIGISGVKIKPQIYLTVGISGQVQHVSGVRDSKVIVAIDKSDSAPIFESADYGIVGDLYQVVPALIEALKK